MKANGSRISWLSALVLGGVLVGAPMVARASQPTTASEADQRAEYFTKLAKDYKFQGGALWKTGNIQRAEADASSCQTVAATMRENTYVVVATPADESQRMESDGAAIAVLVPSNQPAPKYPRCPAP